MSLLHEVAAKLVAVGLGSLTSTPPTIYRGALPATKPNACCALYEYGGMAPEKGFGTAGVHFENPAFQVVFRGEPDDYDGPRAKAETAYLELAKVEAQTLSAGAGGTSAFYHEITPQQAPFHLKRDESRRHHFAINFLAEKEPSA